MAKRTNTGGDRVTVLPTPTTPDLPTSETGTNSFETTTSGTSSFAATSSGTSEVTTETGTGLTGTTGVSGTSGLGTGSSLGAGTDFNQQERGAAGQIKEQVKGEAKNLANQAKEQTKQVASQARDQVQQIVTQQKDQVAERLGGLAGVLHDTANRLRDDERSGPFGGYADQVANQVDRLSTYLRDNDLRGFVRDTESFARRRPDLFLGGTFLAGLMLARFLKASSPEEEYGYGGSSYPYQASTGASTHGTGASAYGTTGASTYGTTGTSTYGTAGTSTYGTTGTSAGQSEYSPERRNPDEAATGGTYNAPLGERS
jgi:hypothetical protein